MENKINIAEILRNCPKGMELYSPIFGKVYLDKIRPHLAIVVTTDKFKEEFLYDGRYGMNGECMLFPSKGKTTWEGFVPPCEFKDGDIAISDKCDIHLLRTTDSSYCAYRERWDGLPKFDKSITTSVRVVRLATEEEKQKLFQAIKDNGYRWDEETKTLVKLIEKPKFKVGDRIRHIVGREEFATVVSVEELHYNLDSKVGTSSFSISLQHEWELVPDKFDINTLTPFESRVLIRDYEENMWVPAFWGCILDKKQIRYLTTRGAYNYCIPYEGNEHLLGTTNDCINYYKTWK